MKVRRQERARLIYYLRVFDAGTGKLLGHLIDLTLEGMMLASEEPIETERSFAVRLDLPRNVMHDSSIGFSVRSRWCRRDPSSTSYTMGFEVTEMSDEARRTIHTLMDQFLSDESAVDPEGERNPPLSM